jgi:uncharacterized protein (TIGR01244 family)
MPGVHFMRLPAFAAALLALTALAAPAFAEKAAISFPKTLERTDFQRIISDVGPLYIAGQPTEAALRELAAQGVKTVINLRTPMEMDDRKLVPFDEEALLKELGMTYVHIPMGRPGLPYTPAAVDTFATAFEADDGKVLLHCTIAWRASHLWAAYLVKYKGWTMEEAIRHADAINLNGFKGQGKQPIEGLLDLAERPAGVK